MTPITRANSWPDGRIPVLLSAHAEDLLRADARALLDYLDREPAAAVDAVAGRLAATRRVRRHRAVIRAADRTELADGLRAVADGAEHRLVARSDHSTAPRLAFVFPGQGSQWPGMGAAAYRQFAEYRAGVDACAAAFTAAGAPAPLRYLTTPDDPESFCETEVEGAQFTHAVALARMWRHHGVLPDITVGHSLGEVGAAYIAGAITLADAVSVVIARAGVVDRLPGRYAVAVLGVDADAARDVIASTPGWLELSVVNAPSSVAVSGDRDAVSAAVARVREQGRFAREITVGFPVHTSILEPLRDDLLRNLPQAEFADSPVQFIGAATGDVVPAGTGFGPYWYGNLRHLVRFDRAFQTALRCGARTFVELSAHPSLLFAMSELLGDTPATLLGSTRRDEPIAETFTANLAAAAVSDPGYDWRAVTPAGPDRLTGFPNAPMRAIPMWATAAPRRIGRAGGVRGEEAPGLRIAAEVWEPVAAQPGPASAATPVPVALLELGDTGRLGGWLRELLGNRPDVVLVGPEAAEVAVVAAPESDTAAPEAGVAAITELVRAGGLRYPAAPGPHCRDVWLVTVGAEQVHPDDPVAPVPAAVAALHRSLGLENPQIPFHHLDLEQGVGSDTARDTDPAVAALLMDAVLSATGGGGLAIRTTGAGAVLYRRGLRDVPAPPPLDRPGLLDEVVITGGAGAIGLHYARQLARRGAKRIVLLSRRPVDPAELAALAAPTGAEVLSVSCDLTDPDAVAAAAGRYGGAGASLLIHAAGAATFDTGDRIDPQATANTLAAKLIGLSRLVRDWPLRPDARLLLCSSVSGRWGGQGHTVYAAANRMLDVAAHRLRAEGRDAVAIRWGLWQSGPETGRGIVDADEAARIRRSGLLPMAPAEAVEASLLAHTHDPLVFAADPDRLRLFLGEPDSVAQPDTTASAPTGGTGPAVDTDAAVRGELAAVLGIPDPDTIDLEASLFDLGVDSLLAVDLRKRFRKVVGRTVPLASLLSGITGTELVDELDAAIRPTIREAPRKPPKKVNSPQ